MDFMFVFNTEKIGGFMKFYRSLIIAALTAFCLIVLPSATEAADTIQIITTIFRKALK